MIYTNIQQLQDALAVGSLETVVIGLCQSIQAGYTIVITYGHQEYEVEIECFDNEDEFREWITRIFGVELD